MRAYVVSVQNIVTSKPGEIPIPAINLSAQVEANNALEALRAAEPRIAAQLAASGLSVDDPKPAA